MINVNKKLKYEILSIPFFYILKATEQLPSRCKMCPNESHLHLILFSEVLKNGGFTQFFFSQ